MFLATLVVEDHNDLVLHRLEGVEESGIFQIWRHWEKWKADLVLQKRKQNLLHVLSLSFSNSDVHVMFYIIPAGFSLSGLALLAEGVAATYGQKSYLLP